MTQTCNKPQTKKQVSWRDFSLVEHLAAFFRTSNRIVARQIASSTYRVNIYDSNGHIVRSEVLRVNVTDAGYTFQLITA